MPTAAIPQTSGRSITLVASSRPPSPTSITQASAGARAKARKATAVVVSKKLARCRRLRPGPPTAGRQARRPRSAVPAMRMRSLKRTRCGLVNKCTLRPLASSAARRKAQVEPLPLVPATWNTGGSRSCGRSSRSSNCGDAVEAEPVEARRKQRKPVELSLDGRIVRPREVRSSGRLLLPLRRQVADQFARAA